MSTISDRLEALSDRFGTISARLGAMNLSRSTQAYDHGRECLLETAPADLARLLARLEFSEQSRRDVIIENHAMSEDWVKFRERAEAAEARAAAAEARLAKMFPQTPAHDAITEDAARRFLEED